MHVRRRPRRRRGHRRRLAHEHERRRRPGRCRSPCATVAPSGSDGEQSTRVPTSGPAMRPSLGGARRLRRGALRPRRSRPRPAGALTVPAAMFGRVDGVAAASRRATLAAFVSSPKFSDDRAARARARPGPRSAPARPRCGVAWRGVGVAAWSSSVPDGGEHAGAGDDRDEHDRGRDAEPPESTAPRAPTPESVEWMAVDTSRRRVSLVERLDREQPRDARVACRRRSRPESLRGGFRQACSVLRRSGEGPGFPMISVSAARPSRDPRADGAGRDLEHLGDLCVVEVAQVPQDHRDPEVVGELGQRGVDVDLVVDPVRRVTAPAVPARGCRRSAPAGAAGAGARRARRSSRRGRARW